MYKIESLLMTGENDPGQLFKAVPGYYKTQRHISHFADELFQVLETICLGFFLSLQYLILVIHRLNNRAIFSAHYGRVVLEEVHLCLSSKFI